MYSAGSFIRFFGMCNPCGNGIEVIIQLLVFLLYIGIDSFTYKANDGSINTNSATVTITVQSLPKKQIWFFA
jgi:hypothetical protein